MVRAVSFEYKHMRCVALASKKLFGNASLEAKWQVALTFRRASKSNPGLSRYITLYRSRAYAQ